MLFHDTDSSSDECESESDDDLEFLLLDSLFFPIHELAPHLNLLDVEETACEQWFRYVQLYTILNQIQSVHRFVSLVIPVL